MAEILGDLDLPPDGSGHWPDRFLVDTGWADARGTSWRAVTNHPTLQARRVDDRLDLRHTADPTVVYSYQLTPTAHPGHIAERT